MTETPPAKSEAPAPPENRNNQTEVFAVHGADPEVLAYAMAKYSRSALSMKESLREISSQRAEQFLNTFYFQYGHRSIADLAHIAFAVERLSLLAAIVLVDEQRWDGQERSTRYQNFRKSGWYMPDFGDDAASATRYRETIDQLFAGYHSVFESVFASLQQQVAKPAEMKQETYDRTLKARAFDVARYLLPLSTNTSLGQIVNARTLETQVSRLLSYPVAEIRQLGVRLQAAASGPAWNVYADDLAALQKDIAALDPALGERAAALLTREVKTAPTLVKYAAVNEYQRQTREELGQAAAGLLRGEAIEPAPLVDLIDDADSLEIDLATTLLYGQSHYPYRQIRRHVATLEEARRSEIIDLGLRHRGRHDELLREFAAGQALRFDILMDIGGFRDMHRHRRCVQVLQGFTAAHGFAIPEGVPEAGAQPLYEATMQAAHEAYSALAEGSAPEAAESAQYVLPLGTRNRALFKMDFAEALYISELRSAPQGHFSYRKVAWEMYRAVERKHPGLAKYFRVTNADEPIDLLKR
ncbi:MAG: FAD-dependent thymidylate synthase [Acidobacteriota bacterium]